MRGSSCNAPFAPTRRHRDRRFASLQIHHPSKCHGFAQVLPSEWGTANKPWFFLTKRYWCPGAKSALSDDTLKVLERDESEGRDCVEPVEDDLRAQVAARECVAIRGKSRRGRQVPTDKTPQPKFCTVTNLSVVVSLFAFRPSITLLERWTPERMSSALPSLVAHTSTSSSPCLVFGRPFSSAGQPHVIMHGAHATYSSESTSGGATR